MLKNSNVRGQIYEVLYCVPNINPTKTPNIKNHIENSFLYTLAKFELFRTYFD